MRRLSLSIILLICLLQLFAKANPPLAPEIPDTLRIHGQTLVDPWAWMKDREHPKLNKHLKLEARYAEKVLKDSRKLAQTLYQEFVAEISEYDESYPWLDKGYYYYSRSSKDELYPLYCRKAGDLSAPEEVILNVNELARKKDYYELGVYAISPDQRYLAFSVDDNGDEDYRLFIKDLHSGIIIDMDLDAVSDFCWYSDSAHFLVVLSNERWQSNTCYLGSRECGALKLLYTEMNPEFDLSLYTSTDDSKIFLLAYNKSSTEVFETQSASPDGVLYSVAGRKYDHLYYPDFLDGRYYFQSNLNHRDSQIYTCSQDSLGIPFWQELNSARDVQAIDDYLILKDYLVILHREDGFDAISICDRYSGKELAQYQPDQASDLGFWHNPDSDADSFTFTMENALSPLSIYEYHIPDADLNLLHRYPETIPRNYSMYQSEVLWVDASDGSKVPLSLVYKKQDQKGPRPLWLNGYGAYGSCEDPYFSESRFSVLDRGVIFAVAHVRGGGELGTSWYEAGKKLNKMNSFTDFIACMDFLIEHGYTTARQMVIEGGSAGGLLMGTVANMAADKCAVVIADVPFVDAVNTMLDSNLPLTVQEYEEWGNPQDPEIFRYMLSYSPYENVRPQSYPAFLISAGWNDTRVGYWEALKWTQRLRMCQQGTQPIVFRLSYNEGHLGSSDRYAFLRQYAQTMAFALSRILSVHY